MLRYFKTALTVLGLVLFAYFASQLWLVYQEKHALQAHINDALSIKLNLEEIGKEFYQWLDKQLFGTTGKPLQYYTQAVAQAEKQIYLLSLYSAGAALLSLLVQLIQPVIRNLVLSLAGVSLIALVTGVFTPVLTITSSQEIPLLGPTLLHYESKGIWQSITALTQQNNWAVASILTAFSLILPALKTLAILWSGLYPKRPPARLLHLFSQLGKWSMTDVFVVAILVVFFAGSKHSLTQSRLEYGLYFFAAYVLLSMIASQLAARHIRTQSSR